MTQIYIKTSVPGQGRQLAFLEHFLKEQSKRKDVFEPKLEDEIKHQQCKVAKY